MSILRHALCFLALIASAAPSAEGETSTPALAQLLEPTRGQEVGLVFEAYLSPHQEPDEEEATPSTTPAQFRSTTPSMSRDKREAAGHRAHGQLRFTRDLSRAFVDVKIEGIDPKTINLFHIHCGKPGILGQHARMFRFVEWAESLLGWDGDVEPL